jgi:hypothetical protein
MGTGAKRRIGFVSGGRRTYGVPVSLTWTEASLIVPVVLGLRFESKFGSGVVEEDDKGVLLPLRLLLLWTLALMLQEG